MTRLSSSERGEIKNNDEAGKKQKRSFHGFYNYSLLIKFDKDQRL